MVQVHPRPNRAKSRLRRWLYGVCAFAALFLGFLYLGSRTEAPGLPPGVKKEIVHLTHEGQTVSVSVYCPANRSEAPLVIVAHGFTRSKRYMAGWGVALAREGFIAAVPTQPAFADHQLNADALADLVAQLRSGKVALSVRPGPKTALMGFSMGGLTTLLAAGKQSVDAWVGLDPVGMDESWLPVGKELRIPCAVLRAEPQDWNKQGNARDLLAILPGPKFAMKVRHATHLDAESPTDTIGPLICGRTDPERHKTFEHYAIAFLKAVLNDDSSSYKVIASAVNDESITEVVSYPLPR